MLYLKLFENIDQMSKKHIFSCYFIEMKMKLMNVIILVT